MSNMDMGTRLSLNPEVTSKLTAALVFLCTGVSVACLFFRFPHLPIDDVSLWSTPLRMAAKSAARLLCCAGVLVSFRPRFGYPLGFIAGATALPWYVLTESSLSPFNSWVYLNIEMPSREKWVLTFVKLELISAALIVATLACSSLRSLPKSWSFRGKSIRYRTWPVIAVSFVAMAVWFARCVTPYSVPGYDNWSNSELRILHIQKRGLRFEETTVRAFRDGRVWIIRDARSLFQYRSEVRLTMPVLGDAPTTYAGLRSLSQSPELWNMRTAAPHMLRSWNAEGWYVVLKDSRLLAFTTQHRTAPPEAITQLFRELVALPATDCPSSAIRDVCLGFCYDPIAALGFTQLSQRQRLLATSSFDPAGY